MHKLILYLIDLITICAAYIFAMLLRFHGLVDTAHNQWMTLFFLLIMIPIVFYFYDLYNHLLYTQRPRIFFKFMKAWLVTLLLYVVVGFLTKYYFLIESRIFITFFYIFALILFFFIRIICAKKILEYYFKYTGRILCCKYIGAPELFKPLERFFKNNGVTGLKLVCREETDTEHNTQQEIFLYSEAETFERLYNEIKENTRHGMVVHVASLLFKELDLKWEWCSFNGAPVYTFHQKENQFWRERIKRCIDFFGALFCLFILAPFFLLISIAIKLDSRGPVIYKQKRCGKGGKTFTFYKFRSMYEHEKPETVLEAEFNHYRNSRVSKMEILDSEYITPIGKILRKTSIDEWPQFINILKGEMSLIGPRPHRPHEVKYYKEWHRDRLSVSQGLTGLWQIYGRGEIPSDRSIFLDLIYVINRSLSLDIKLLFQTIPVVILGKGAY